MDANRMLLIGTFVAFIAIGLNITANVMWYNAAEQYDKIYYDPTLDLDEKQLKYKAIGHEKNMSNAIGGPANILIYLSIAIFLLAMAMIIKEKKLNVAVYTDAKRPPQVPPTNQPKNQLIDQLTNPPTNPQPPKV